MHANVATISTLLIALSLAACSRDAAEAPAAAGAPPAETTAPPPVSVPAPPAPAPGQAVDPRIAPIKSSSGDGQPVGPVVPPEGLPPPPMPAKGSPSPLPPPGVPVPPPPPPAGG